MREKIVTFLSSYGLITLGVFLLLLSSVGVKIGYSPLLHFPESGEGRAAQAGGDVVITSQFPESKPRPTVPLAKDKSQFSGELTAISALVVDDKTDTILFTKNHTIVRPLASITKLMTALVLMDLPMNWSSSTVICTADCDKGSQQMNVGEKYTLDDLLHVALIGSSNTAISALVRMTGITTENFVLLMNKKAAKLGLASAHFVEPTGLDSGNVATAEEVAKILKEVLKYKKVYTVMKVGEYYAHPLNKEKVKRVWSTNWLLTNWIPSDFQFEEIVGKTGFIIDSKYNFTVRLTDKDSRVIRVVILGADSNEERFREARDLAEWAFNHYLWPEDDGYNQLVE